ncbi:MAG: hypothetical protein LRZ88_13490 [Candidatus Cloacimonetes bacterium]|nr:hypothetical protein [Candidatus Cloacimonadota bacterium]
MKYVLIVMIVMFCTALWAKDGVYTFHGKEGAIIGVWGFAEYAYGSINNVNMQGMQSGLAVEFLSHIQVKVFKSRYAGHTLWFDAAKYYFKGSGVRLSPVFHVIGLDFLPSIGLENGTIEIGEGEYTHWLWGDQYMDYREETIYYVPISLEVQAKIGRILLLSGRYFVTTNSDYPMNGFCLMLGLGWK